jgi:hypothetical protein
VPVPLADLRALIQAQARDLLAHASSLRVRHTDAYVLGMALAQLKALADAADQVL